MILCVDWSHLAALFTWRWLGSLGCVQMVALARLENTNKSFTSLCLHVLPAYRQPGLLYVVTIIQENSTVHKISICVILTILKSSKGSHMVKLRVVNVWGDSTKYTYIQEVVPWETSSVNSYSIVFTVVPPHSDKQPKSK